MLAVAASLAQGCGPTSADELPIGGRIEVTGLERSLVLDTPGHIAVLREGWAEYAQWRRIREDDVFIVNGVFVVVFADGREHRLQILNQGLELMDTNGRRHTPPAWRTMLQTGLARAVELQAELRRTSSATAPASQEDLP